MVTRAEIVAEARTWVGVPFRHMGRTRQDGVDCVGLVVAVTRALGIPVRDYPRNYTRRGEGFDLIRHASENCRSVPLRQARDGDVVVFHEGHAPCHVGIMTTRADGRRYVVQAIGAVSYRRVIEAPYEGEWRGKARYAFELLGVED